MLTRTTTAVLAGASALAISCVASFAAGNFEGNWQVKDTHGTPFQIELKEGGNASADRAGESMTGTWKESGDAAVINWSDGWTTKIAKAGDGYTKSAWKKGMSMDDKPTNTSDAMKK
jgi:hypothetical protein